MLENFISKEARDMGTHPEFKAETIANLQEEIINSELETPPRLELSAQSQAKMAELLNILIKENKPAVVAIVRCWNKTPEDLAKFQTRIEAMKSKVPELAGILIAINADQDKNSATAPAVENTLSAVPMVAVPVRGYSWTAGLNGPAALLHACLENHPEILNKTEIFNLSFDVDIPESSLELIHTAVSEGKPALSLRIEENIQNKEQAESVQSEYTIEIQALLARISDIIKNPTITADHRQTYVETSGKSLAVLGRNTNLIAPLADVSSLGGFDPSCNKIGGMEDHDFFWRMRFAGDTHKQTEYEIALKKPVMFEDPSWNKMPAGSVEEMKGRAFKYDHEVKALTQIINRVSLLVQSKQDLTVPTSQRDFKY